MSRSHGRQSTPSSAPEVNREDCPLTIGELARRAGVTTSALRYYEELGLLPSPARVSGQRRYPASAARLVAAILLYSDAGFTLAEPNEDLAQYPNFNAGLTARLAGQPLSQSHPRRHGQG